jgi:hypothetical protein
VIAVRVISVGLPTTVIIGIITTIPLDSTGSIAAKQSTIAAAEQRKCDSNADDYHHCGYQQGLGRVIIDFDIDSYLGFIIII